MAFDVGKSYTHNTYGYQIFIKRSVAGDPPGDPTLTITLQELPGPLEGFAQFGVLKDFLESVLVFDDWTEVT